MKKHIAKFLSLVLTVVTVFSVMIPASASSTGANPGQLKTAADSAVSADYEAVSLAQLVNELHGSYYLDTYVSLLQEANDLNGFGNRLLMTTKEWPISIYDQLSVEGQQTLRNNSTYQGFQYVMSTVLYSSNENFRKQVNAYYASFMDYLPARLQACLTDFMPPCIVYSMNPDELVEVGNVICGTSGYQKLHEAMYPLWLLINADTADLSDEVIDEYFTPNEVEQLKYNILSAAGAIWPQYLKYLPATLG